MSEFKKSTKNKKHYLYNFFNPRGNGKGVTKEQAAKMPKNISNFFRFYFSNFNTMFALNIFAFLGNFPLLFGLYALTGSLNTNSMSPASSLFAPLYGATTISGSFTPASAALFGVHGIQSLISVPTTATKIFFYITALVIFTFGLVNLSSVFVMRNIIKGDPSMVFSDIKYSIKKNWKQGLLLGIIDFLFIILIVYDLLLFYFSSSIQIYNFFFGVMLIIAMIYTIMRFYMYIMLVTFDLSIYKIIKNAFIFSILGFKRNITAFIGIILTFAINYFIFIFATPLGIALPVLVLVSFTNFMGVYAAYPKIKEIMIDPYYVSDDVGAKKHSEVTDQDEPEKPIFTDRG